MFRFWHRCKERLRSLRWVRWPYVVWGGYSLCLLPSFAVLFLFSLHYSRLEVLEKSINTAKAESMKALHHQEARALFHNHYQNVNVAQFLKRLEEQRFLCRECQELSLLSLDPAFAKCQRLVDRNQELSPAENRLKFVEVKQDRSALLHDLDYAQGKDVELNGEDLRVVLSLLEGSSSPVDPSSPWPQVVIRSLSLRRKRGRGMENYQLQLGLICRASSFAEGNVDKGEGER